MGSQIDTDLILSLLEAEKELRLLCPRPDRAVRHKKSGGTYKIIRASLKESDLTVEVVYEGSMGLVFHRPLDEFLERFESL